MEKMSYFNFERMIKQGNTPTQKLYEITGIEKYSELKKIVHLMECQNIDQYEIRLAVMEHRKHLLVSFPLTYDTVFTELQVSERTTCTPQQKKRSPLALTVLKN